MVVGRTWFTRNVPAGAHHVAGVKGQSHEKTDGQESCQKVIGVDLGTLAVEAKDSAVDVGGNG